MTSLLASQAVEISRFTPLALVIDADLDARRLCSDVLTRCGFSVREMDNGVAAVTAVREQTPDVIFVDPQLRDVPGRQAVAWLKSMPALSTTPIIMLGIEIAQNTALAASPTTAWLTKPLSPFAVRRIVQNVLRK